MRFQTGLTVKSASLGSETPPRCKGRGSSHRGTRRTALERDVGRLHRGECTAVAQDRRPWPRASGRATKLNWKPSFEEKDELATRVHPVLRRDNKIKVYQGSTRLSSQVIMGHLQSTGFCARSDLP